MTTILAIFGVSFSVFGIMYIISGQVLWGLLVLVLGTIYLFGFESFPSDEDRHRASHVLVGGILSGISGIFLILEKLLTYLTDSFHMSKIDVSFAVVSLVALFISAFISKKFD